MLPVLVWIPNAFVVVLTVLLVFLFLEGVVRPPRSRAEAVFEAHKVIVVASFSLAAAGVIEVFSFFTKQPTAVIQSLVGAIALLFAALFGIVLFVAALMQDEHIRETGTCERIHWFQVGVGIFLFLFAATIEVKFKSLEAAATSASVVRNLYA